MPQSIVGITIPECINTVLHSGLKSAVLEIVVPYDLWWYIWVGCNTL